MRLEIAASNAIEKQLLVVYDQGISYSEGPGLGLGKQSRHWFREIDAVLRTASPAPPVLSVQVGTTIYRIRYNPNDGQHRAAVDFLVQQAKEAQRP